MKLFNDVVRRVVDYLGIGTHKRFVVDGFDDYYRNRFQAEMYRPEDQKTRASKT